MIRMALILLFLVFLNAAIVKAGVIKPPAYPSQNQPNSSESYYMSQPVKRISSAFYVDRAGQIRKMGHLRGTPVIANLWNYDCRNCVIEITKDPQGRLISSQVHVDPLQDFIAAYGLVQMPTTASFDQNGQMRGLHSGPSNWTKGQLSTYSYSPW